MPDLFVPGFAADPLDDLAWQMLHGAPEAVAPNFTRDVARSLLDARLAAHNSARGVAHDEVDAAFAWLTSPYVSRAVWLQPGRRPSSFARTDDRYGPKCSCTGELRAPARLRAAA